MRFCVLDEREIWHGPLLRAALGRGYQARRIRRGSEAAGPGVGFIRCHADPEVLPVNRQDDLEMRACLTMVQDRAQVEVYEDKSEQFRRWGVWMPPTWRFTSEAAALTFVEHHGGPLVAKADVGASSTNVRVLMKAPEQRAHVHQVFSSGWRVDHGAGGRGGRIVHSQVRDYVLLQEYVPHTVTWRVNIIGRHWAVFRRFNHPDRPVAQTGNVEPVMTLDGQIESLLDFSRQVVAAIDTRWCALDILETGRNRWRLLETSLAWPWPSPGDCMRAPFFGETRRQWKDMWELLLDELEAGVWAVDSGNG